MKKVLAIFIAALLIIPNTFAFTSSAQTVAEATSEFVVRTGASAWINDWNDSTRSVKLDLQGSLKSDYYYNCFEKYFEISVTNPEHFYSSPSNPYFYLKSKTDITQHI